MAVIAIAPMRTITDESSGWVTCWSMSSTFSTIAHDLALHDPPN
jgi:hypothetical protein